MGGNEPVRRYEFDIYQQAIRRELDDLRKTVDRLEAEHDTDMDGLAKADKERLQARKDDRRWTFGQLVAVVSAVAALGAFWLAIVAR